MASLYIDRRGVELRLDGQAIAFYENNIRIGTIPIAPLERVFLKGDVRMHSGLLGRLGENGTGIVVLSGRKASVNMLMARPHNDAARRVTQYFLCRDETFCCEFSRCIVETKLKDQLAFLAELREKKLSARYELTYRCRQIESALESLSAQQDIPAIRGVEGNAAASYFAGLAACQKACIFPEETGDRHVTRSMSFCRSAIRSCMPKRSLHCILRGWIRISVFIMRWISEGNRWHAIWWNRPEPILTVSPSVFSAKGY